jgi:UMF1 family MFS transporter
MSEAIRLNDKKTIRAWAMFDWANSAYALVISTAVFPPFFIAMTDEQIKIGDTLINNSALYSFAVSFAFFLLVFINPIAGGIADSGGRRKFFLNLFTSIGAISCMAMVFFNDAGDVWWASTAFVLATVGFTAGTVFYNAYLPEIVTEDKYDKVSALGFAYGYVGSVLLLIFILIMIQKPEWFGMEASDMQARLGFLLVGLWWLGFAQYSIRRLPADKKGIKLDNPISKAWAEIKNAWSKASKNKNFLLFMGSFFFYIAGLNVVVYVAAIFADKVLNITQDKLIITILIIQLLGLIGAFLFAWVSKNIGNKKSIIIMVTIWMCICGIGYFINSVNGFYALSAAVGLVVGGIQSISRSAYAKMIGDNPDELNSFFSLYDVIRNIAIVSGLFVFGFVDQLTGSLRYSILSTAAFFLVGLVFMLFADLKKAKV